LEQSRAKYGRQRVKSISVVVDRGSSKTSQNFAVKLKEVTVDGSKATDSLTVVEPKSYKKVGPAGLPKSGRSMIFSKQTAPPATPLLTIGDEQIKNVGDLFVAEVSTKSLAGSGKYSVDLCLFGGRCLPYRAFFDLP
jgi:hypothetical protein